jgi:hypothetical protein
VVKAAACVAVSPVQIWVLAPGGDRGSNPLGATKHVASALRVQVSPSAPSLLFGALSGILYFRLLARGIGRLGTSSKIVGKVQLLVPVILVLVSSRFPQLDLIPALLGFLLYKPALIIQFLSMP